MLNISDRHLQRLAVVYVRQSSDEQVREAVGSTEVQRGQVEVARQLGWSREQVELNEEDLGISASYPRRRRGLRRLNDGMKAGRVGAVFATCISRIARNFIDLADFVTTARDHDVLLIVQGHVTDFANPDAEFASVIMGFSMTHQNRSRVKALTAAKRAKIVTRGEESTTPPVGYVWRRGPSGGRFELDPDEAVCDRIRLVFTLWDKFNTPMGIVRHLWDHNLLWPRKPSSKRPERWVPATPARVMAILRHPAYAGVYEYGKTKYDPSRVSRTGMPRRVRTAARERFRRENSHPAYIPLEKFGEIQAVLDHRRHNHRPPAGRGGALVQGLVRCMRHGCLMRTRYCGQSGSKRGSYSVCQPGYGRQPHAPTCIAIPSRYLDRLVERELLQVVTRPSESAIADVVREAMRDDQMAHQAREGELRRLEHEALDLEREYLSVPAEQEFVKRRLGDHFNDALGRLEERRAFYEAHPLQPVERPDPAILGRLTSLLDDLPRLWSHPRVTAQVRKEVVRALVNTIEVTPGQDFHHLVIEWTGGARSTHHIPMASWVKREVEALWRTGCLDEAIADDLTRQGIFRASGGAAGTPHTASWIHRLIRRMGLWQEHAQRASQLIIERSARQVRDGEIATELNALGIRHRLGWWTPRRVSTLRLSVAGIGCQPLRWRVRPLVETGMSPEEITERLRREGVTTRCGAPIPLSQVKQAAKRRAPAMSSIAGQCGAAPTPTEGRLAGRRQRSRQEGETHGRSSTK